jgi:hypothetical protein
MGNLITSMVTVASPLITREFLIPKLMHPLNWGGIPFKPPGIMMYMFLYILFNLSLIGSAATVSGLMTTVRQCNKWSLRSAIGNALWACGFALLGMIILAFVPFIKSPVLAVIGWLPYANHLVTGLYLAIAVLIGGMIGNNYNRHDVCT